MAGPGTGADKTYVADVSMVSSQHCIMVQGAADGSMKLPSTAGEGKILGVLLDYPASGQAGRVRHRDFATVVYAGTIARGDQLEIANAAGGVRTLTAQGNCIVGQAQQSGVTGDLSEMRVRDIPNDAVFPDS